MNETKISTIKGKARERGEICDQRIEGRLCSLAPVEALRWYFFPAVSEINLCIMADVIVKI